MLEDVTQRLHICHVMYRNLQGVEVPPAVWFKVHKVGLLLDAIRFRRAVSEHETGEQEMLDHGPPLLANEGYGEPLCVVISLLVVVVVNVGEDGVEQFEGELGRHRLSVRESALAGVIR